MVTNHASPKEHLCRYLELEANSTSFWKRIHPVLLTLLSSYRLNHTAHLSVDYLSLYWRDTVKMWISIREQLGSLVFLAMSISLTVIALATWYTNHKFVLDVRLVNGKYSLASE
jgi:TRAP-type mannitol/chloroaromatic compound transport system permease small subunit